jgi:ubiquinone/menaquinone biosynthesis C-methylase UbiE
MVANYHGSRRCAVDAERRRWQNPEAILNDIGLKAGFVFIDLGCGGGFFTLPAARIVGAHGKVYGLDIDAQSLQDLRHLADREGLQNVELVPGKAEEVILCEKCADIIFLGIVLHDFQDPARVLENCRKMVKPAGKLVNLDWKKQPTGIGPPLKKRFSEEYAGGLIEAAGFRVSSIKSTGAHHYIIVAEP